MIGGAVPSPPPLVLATRNQGKLRELRRLLAPVGWRLLAAAEAGVTEEAPEDATSYAANAVAKATAVAAATGMAVLGDDSGIEVEALGGWPGPASARWLGPGATDGERLSGLLEEVARRCPDDPRVRYVAALALARPGAEPVVAHGMCLGRLTAPSGGAGFGYDPAFWSLDLGMTFGDAPDEDKDRVSHRARAVARLAESGVLTPAPGRAVPAAGPLLP